MSTPARIVEVGPADLPLHCPRPGEQAWCSHPRVFLDVAQKGQALCPYCGTLYKYTGPADARHGH
ncbi:MAG: zinc-finger domain-containing protein [Pseudomonadota bacterium]